MPDEKGALLTLLWKIGMVLILIWLLLRGLSPLEVVVLLIALAHALRAGGAERQEGEGPCWTPMGRRPRSRKCGRGRRGWTPRTLASRDGSPAPSAEHGKAVVRL